MPQQIADLVEQLKRDGLYLVDTQVSLQHHHQPLYLTQAPEPQHFAAYPPTVEMTLNVAYTASAIPSRSRNKPGTLAYELHSFVQSPGNLMGQPRSITMPDGSEWYVKNFTHTIKATSLPTIELTLVGIPKRAEEEAAMTAEEAMKVENVAKWIDPEPPVRLKSITPIDADTVEVQAEVQVPIPLKKIDIQLTMPEENKGPLSDPELLEAIDKRWPKKPKLERKDAFWRDEEKK